METQTIIDANGTLTGRAYTLTEEAAKNWGCYVAEGCEAEDGGSFRRQIRRALEALAARIGAVEVYTPETADSSGWMVDRIETEADAAD